MKKLEFTETQKFAQLWIWLLLFGVTLLPVYGLYQQVILKEPFGDNPMSDTGLIIWVVAMLALMVFFRSMKLNTHINDSYIRITFFPLMRKTIAWNEVKHAEVLNYGFVGGWGIRLWTKYGTVYNVKGKEGLQLVLKNGKKYLIGTQKPEEIRKIINKLYHN